MLFRSARLRALGVHLTTILRYANIPDDKHSSYMVGMSVRGECSHQRLMQIRRGCNAVNRQGIPAILEAQVKSRLVLAERYRTHCADAGQQRMAQVTPLLTSLQACLLSILGQHDVFLKDVWQDMRRAGATIGYRKLCSIKAGNWLRGQSAYALVVSKDTAEKTLAFAQQVADKYASRSDTRAFARLRDLLHYGFLFDGSLARVGLRVQHLGGTTTFYRIANGQYYKAPDLQGREYAWMTPERATRFADALDACYPAEYDVLA